MRALAAIALAATLAACRHAYPPVVPPAPGQPGRDADRLELGDRYSTSGPQKPGTYRDGKRISLDEFLRIAGKAELADEIDTRRWAKRGLIAAGVLTFAGAILFVRNGPDCDRRFPTLDEYNGCIEDRGGHRRWGLLIGLAGAGLIIGGIELSTHAPSTDELTVWAAAHNRTHRIPPHRAAVTIAPALVPSGGGLVMTGSF